MSPIVLAAVLSAAVLHGTWNAIAKAIPARLVASALIGAVYLVAGAVGCLVLPPIAAASVPYLIASAIAQTLYLVLLTAAYARSEFGRAYPLTRGLSVLGITLASTTLLGERLTPVQLLGIAVVALSLLSLSWTRGGAPGDRVGTLLMIAVGATVTVYSVLDGIGVRASGQPLGYAAWLFLLQGAAIPLVCLALAPDRRAFVLGLRTHAMLGVIGGVISLAAYTIVVWAQSVAPLAVVSALRETGVIAASAIGYVVFRERLRPWRLVASLCAVAGIVAIRAGG
ncbi:EamA family transporter [Agromyces sp. NPDC055658]